jgi:putative endonuclease
MATKTYILYLLQCKDHSFYCGITNDLTRRLDQHSRGKASKYTRSRLPILLITALFGLTHSEALRLELKVKSLPRSQKISFIEKLRNSQRRKWIKQNVSLQSLKTRTRKGRTHRP